MCLVSLGVVVCMSLVSLNVVVFLSLVSSGVVVCMSVVFLCNSCFVFCVCVVI